MHTTRFLFYLNEYTKEFAQPIHR